RLRRVFDIATNSIDVAADPREATIDHELRRVNLVSMEGIRVVDGLPGRKLGGRETIVPAEAIPIVHVLADRQYHDVGRRLLRELAEHRIRRRTARTPL